MQAPNETSAVRRAYDVLRKAANAKPFLDVDAREDLLSRLEKMLLKHRDDIVKAIDDDFGHRNETESLVADVFLPLDGVRDARKHVREWMHRRTVGVHPLFIPSHAFIEPVPLGVVGDPLPVELPGEPGARARRRRVRRRQPGADQALRADPQDLRVDRADGERLLPPRGVLGGAGRPRRGAGRSPRCPSITCSSPGPPRPAAWWRRPRPRT